MSSCMLSIEHSLSRFCTVACTLLDGTRYFAGTLLLFTRSDTKTILIPATIFGTVASPQPAAWVVLPRLIWVWFNLLQCDVANQSLRPDEDRLNKPWRPIPAMRISQQHARLLRWALTPLCIGLSCLCHVSIAGIVLAIAIAAYNELEMDVHWAMRTLLNVVGYACFNAGASRILCDHSLRSSSTSVSAQVMIALLILTTIHAQDFRDIDGDLASGRDTFPVIHPRASRLSMLLLLPAWSLFLSTFWRLDVWTSMAVMALGFHVGWGFYSNESGPPARDHSLYQKYNVWLCCAHVIPFMYARA